MPGVFIELHRSHIFRAFDADQCGSAGKVFENSIDVLVQLWSGGAVIDTASVSEEVALCPQASLVHTITGSNVAVFILKIPIYLSLPNSR